LGCRRGLGAARTGALILRLALELDRYPNPKATPALSLVVAAQWGHVGLAAFVHIHAAIFTLETLVDNSIEQRATVVAKGGRPIRVELELVRGLESGHHLGHLFHLLVVARTNEVDKVVAPSVHHKGAILALVALFSKAPNEVLAVRAKGGLLEETGHKTVVLYQRHVPLLQRPLASPRPRPKARPSTGTPLGAHQLGAPSASGASLCPLGGRRSSARLLLQAATSGRPLGCRQAFVLVAIWLGLGLDLRLAGRP